jgi:hypothetical protein
MPDLFMWLGISLVNIVICSLGYLLGQTHLRYMQMRDEYIILLANKRRNDTLAGRRINGDADVNNIF